MHQKSIKINMLLNAIKTILATIFPLITFPYVSRVLNTEGIGKVQFSASIISYFALIATLGINTYAIREGAGLKDKKEKLEEFCNQIFSFNMITTIVSYVGIIILLFFIDKGIEYKHLIIIQSMTIIFTTLGVDWINSIFEDYLYITVRSILIQIITLILTFVLINDSGDYYFYALISVFSSVGANILNFFYVRKYCKIKFTTKINLKKHIKPIIILFSNSIAATIYKDADITMLGIMSGDYAVGIYYIAVKIYYIIKQILNSVITVTIPRVSNYTINQESEKKNKLLNNIFKMIIIFVLPAVTGIVALRKEIIWLVAGESYYESTGSLAALAIALMFAVIANFSSNLILILNKQEKKSLRATIIAAICNVVLNLIFIPVWKATGAAITTLISEAVVAVVTSFYARKYFKPEGIRKVIISTIIGCILIAVIGFIVKLINFGEIINMIAIIVFSIIAYVTTTILINGEKVKEILVGIK